MKKKESLNIDELNRFYERGSLKLDKRLRLEKILRSLGDIEVYNREVRGVSIANSLKVRSNFSNRIVVDEEDSDRNTTDEELKISMKCCDHPACHHVKCV